MNKFFCIIFILFTFSPFLSTAQDFEVAPVRINFSGTPGETMTRNVSIKNHGNRVETISIRPRDFLVYRQGNMEVLPAESTKNSIAKWVNVNPSFVVLEPNQEMSVQVNMQAPQDDYTAKWGILSFESTAEQTAFSADQTVRAGVMLSARIDIFLNFNPVGGAPDRVNISNLREITTDQDQERKFAVNLDNLGDKITACRLYLIASDLSTGEEKRFPTVNITTYPQSSRTVELILPNQLKKGQYALAAILDHSGSTSLKGTQLIINVE